MGDVQILQALHLVTNSVYESNIQNHCAGCNHHFCMALLALTSPEKNNHKKIPPATQKFKRLYWM